MLGRSCSLERLAGRRPGSRPRVTGSAASPERAAQAAAGIANSAFSPEYRTTSFDGLPRAAEKKRSMRRRALERVVALHHGGLVALGPRDALAPMRITWASLERSEPLGLSRSSVSSRHGGQLVAVGEQDRRADRAARPGPRRRRRLPVVLVHEHHGGRAGRSRRWRGTPRWPPRRRRPRRPRRPRGSCSWWRVDGKPSFSAASSSSACAPSWRRAVLLVAERAAARAPRPAAGLRRGRRRRRGAL